MSESETTKGALLYQDVSTLLGDECGCGGAFLECNEDCCPTATVEGKEIKTYGGWLIADYICGKDTMLELKKACNAYDHVLSVFDGTYEDLKNCVNCEGPLVLNLCPKCNILGGSGKKGVGARRMRITLTSRQYRRMALVVMQIPEPLKEEYGLVVSSLKDICRDGHHIGMHTESLCQGELVIKTTKLEKFRNTWLSDQKGMNTVIRKIDRLIAGHNDGEENT